MGRLFSATIYPESATSEIRKSIYLRSQAKYYRTMGKTLKYQNIISNFLSEYAAIPYANNPELEKQVIEDRGNNHFQLLTVGWTKSGFVCNIVFHFDIKNEKIWIQSNNTELSIGDELVDLGVPKHDIVFGYHRPEVRHELGFATA